jgi:hypothetical protein
MIRLHTFRLAMGLAGCGEDSVEGVGGGGGVVGLSVYLSSYEQLILNISPHKIYHE